MLENLIERIENINVWRTGFKTCVFEKHFISYSCIIFIKYNALRSFCTKLLWFFKNLFFLEFRLIEPVFRSIKIAIKIFGLSMPDSIDVRSILDWSQLKNFQFLCFWPKFFSMHHLCLGFTCIALFLYPSYSFVVISLSVFTHNMHTLCYIGYSTWSKNWLINFWTMYFLVYAFFMCEM